MTPPKTPRVTSPVAANGEPAAPAPSVPLPERFEDAVQELEQIVAAMESGNLPLEESLTRFQRGNELLRHCRSALEAAETRIRVLQDGELTDLASSQDSE